VVWTGSDGSVGDSCEHANEFSSSVNGGKFTDHLSVCQLFKQNSAPWSK
jgi:hypothetical protein